MKQLITLLLLLVSMTTAAGDVNGTIDVGGTTRNYITYVPAGGCPEGRPLLISCHGMNQSAAYQKEHLAIEAIADTAKFITVFPDGIDKGWDISGDRDVNFVLKIIDKMVSLYQIDRNRVYLSGFSMGGMFTYYCMNKIPDKIAAFAPISGYPMGGATANAATRPIPIIHTHGTGDDVCTFDRVQSCLDVWIQHNHCPTTAAVTTNYLGYPHATYYRWGPGDEDVEVVLLTFKDKGHWVSNDGVLTGNEIWKFCKGYTLDKTGPEVHITSPRTGMRYINFNAQPADNDITIDATATAREGSITKVEILGDGQQLATITTAPYTCNWPAVAKGTHEITVIATDTEGRQTRARSSITVQLPTALALGATFNTGGALPLGWETYDGKDRRVGALSGLGSGARVLQMTGTPRDFDYALYTRNATGGENNGYAAFASGESLASLTLQPGHYTIDYTIASWNMADFGTVRLNARNLDNDSVLLERTDNTTSNVGNTASNAFSGSAKIADAFDVHKACKASLTFYTGDGAWADLLLAGLTIRYTGPDEITNIAADRPITNNRPAYNLAGQRVDSRHKGLTIQDGKLRIRN